ncbi:MAG: hypothetical protein JNM56_13670 [Planctomycetia bacterium]|nr:hypothetical protein [Planctomycetia bacterium]
MSVRPQHPAHPRFLGTLEELTQALDDLATPAVQSSRAVPLVEERADATGARTRYEFNNWAQRLREGPPPMPGAKRTAAERWPVVFGVGALLWLAMTGIMVAAWHMSQPRYVETALLSPPGVEEVQSAVAPPLDPAEELAATVDDLQAARAHQTNVARAPRILAQSPAAPHQGECLGTSVKFVDSAAEAALQARSNRKLMLLLNVSGDFDDSRFT